MFKTAAAPLQQRKRLFPGAWVSVCSGFCGIVMMCQVMAADSIEILYEQGDTFSFSSIQWLLLCAFIFIALASSVAGLYLVFRSKLETKENLLKQAEARLKEAQDIARIGSWSRDFENGESFWSEEALSVLGLDKEKTDIPHYETMVHPDDVERVTETIATAYFQGGAYQCDHRIVCPDGRDRYVRLAGKVFLGDGCSPVRETGTIQDITSRKLAEIALQKSEARMRSILDAAPYPIIILELNSTYNVLYANKNAYELFGISSDIPSYELNSENLWFNLTDRKDYMEKVRSSWSLMDVEMLMKGKEGKQFWASLSGNCLEYCGDDAAFISIMDVSERKKIQQEMERLATTDPLTGIFNRRSFFQLARKELRRAIRYNQLYSLLMLDIDNFKKINDQYGHGFGDAVLCRFTKVVLNCLREEDLFGRIGGEEFCVVLTTSESDGGYLVAERIRKSWNETLFETDGENVNFSVSIGVSVMQNQMETVENIMERADKGLYKAKELGRNCVVIQHADEADGSKTGLV